MAQPQEQQQHNEMDVDQSDANTDPSVFTTSQTAPQGHLAAAADYSTVLAPGAAITGTVDIFGQPIGGRAYHDEVSRYF